MNNRKTKRRVFSVLLAVVLLAGILPISTFAAGGQPRVINMSTVGGNVTIKSSGLYFGNTLVDSALDPDGYELTGTTDQYNVVVEPGITTKLVLNNVSITSHVQSTAARSGSCIDVSKANVRIVLKGNNSLIYDCLPDEDGWKEKGCALEKSGDAGTLSIETIDGTNNHSLLAQGKKFHDGAIGSSLYQVRHSSDAGFMNFTIKSGKITALAGNHAPGIGANCFAHHENGATKATGNMRIEGGIVEARAGRGCSGIGGGQGVPLRGLVITGGAKVTAYGGMYSPGIGSGGMDTGSNPANLDVTGLVISGGDTIVTAYGDQGSNMPGIGCGAARNGVAKGTVSAKAVPIENYQGYVKYGTSPTDYSYSTANPETPFPGEEEFGSYLQAEADANRPVFYTQVYFGPYKDNNALDNNTEIGANDAVMKTGGAPLSANDLRNVAHVSGHDENGNPISTDKIIPNQAQIDAINAAKQAGKVGDFLLEYKLTYTDPSGASKILTVKTTVFLRDEGTDSSQPMPAIAANHAIHVTGGSGFSDEDLLKLCDVKANDAQGRNVIKNKEDGSLDNKGVTIDAGQKAALNAAKVAGKTGSYPVTYSYTDPESGTNRKVTVNVELRDFGTDTVGPGKPENGANKAHHKADGGEFTEEQVRTLTSAVAKDRNGNTIPSNQIRVKPEDLAALNSARRQGKEGVFDITYSYTDSDGSTVTFKGQVSLWNEKEPVITANDATVNAAEAGAIPDKNGLAVYLNPSVTDKNGNPAQPTEVVVSDSDMQNIKNGVPGTYPVTYKFKYKYIDNQGVEREGEKSVTVTLTVTPFGLILRGNKTLTGRDGIRDGQFEFKVEQISGPAGGADVPQNAMVKTNGTFAFDNIEFRKPGDYEFRVSEVNKGAAGYSYDTRPVTVTAPVTMDPATGKATLGTVTYSKNGQQTDGISFENTYTPPAAITQSYSVKKTLKEEGEDRPIRAGMFKVKMTASDMNPAPVTGLPTAEIEIAADGTCSLGPVGFSREGTYYFTASEINGGTVGYVYDDKSVTVKTEVELNEQDNTLFVKKMSFTKAGEQADGIIFDNIYLTPDGAAKIFEGKKILRENGEIAKVRAGQFKFTITVPGGTQVVNTIYESSSGEIRPEGTESVSGNSPSAEIGSVSDNSPQVAIENNVSDSLVMLRAPSSGGNPAEIKGLPTGPIEVEEGGLFHFGTLVFPKAGTYVLQIAEVNENKVGYTYDENPVTMEVDVALNEATNQMEITGIRYEKNGAPTDGIVFENSYIPPNPVDYKFTINKKLTLDGRDISVPFEGIFRFAVRELEDNPSEITGLPQGSLPIKLDKTVDFDKLTFWRGGTYRFEVSELVGDDLQFSYDCFPVIVYVDVALDESTNTISVANVSYMKHEEWVDGINFWNTQRLAVPPEEPILPAEGVLPGGGLPGQGIPGAGGVSDGEVLPVTRPGKPGISPKTGEGNGAAIPMVLLLTALPAAAGFIRISRRKRRDV